MTSNDEPYFKSAWRLLRVIPTRRVHVFTYEETNLYTRILGDVISRKMEMMFVHGRRIDWFVKEDFPSLIEDTDLTFYGVFAHLDFYDDIRLGKVVKIKEYERGASTAEIELERYFFINQLYTK